MRVTLLLGGPLGKEAGQGTTERFIDLPDGSRVQDIVASVGLSTGRVKLILLNGRGATLESQLQDGDRVALFPPELSFNTFVSLSFRRERVEAREMMHKRRPTDG